MRKISKKILYEIAKQKFYMHEADVAKEAIYIMLERDCAKKEITSLKERLKNCQETELFKEKNLLQGKYDRVLYSLEMQLDIRANLETKCLELERKIRSLTAQHSPDSSSSQIHRQTSSEHQPTGSKPY